MNRATLQSVINDPTSKSGRIFDLSVQAVIAIWLIAYCIDTLPNLPSDLRLTLHAVEISVTALFTAEYLLRLYTADRPLQFVLSFWGIIDLLSILPFYMSMTGTLRVLRVLRLLRLFRVLKIARYSRALQRLQRAWLIARDEFLMFLFVAMILLFLAAAGIHHFESEAQPDKFASIFHSLWWAVCSLTTVGYGDAYPPQIPLAVPSPFEHVRPHFVFL